MSFLKRRGFTLVELMIAIALLGLVSVSLYKVLLNNQRTFAAQTQRIDLQQNIRAATTILPAEFRELDAADGDITAMSATSITIRAMRQLAIICTAPVLPVGVGLPMTFTVRQQPFYGNRQNFATNDSIFVYDEGNAASRLDDRWQLSRVTLSPTNLNCPGAAPNAGFLVTALPVPAWGAAMNVANAITAGAPVRGFSTITYLLWQSPTDNQYYLAQTAAGTTQPLVGPLTGAAGLSFIYYDSTGTTITATPANVRMIEIRVRGRTTQVIRQANDQALAYKTDSVIARVALRNNTRCGGVALPAC